MKVGALGYEERSLRQVVLRGDRLQGLVGQPFLQRTHRGGIAGKHTAGKRVDLKES